MQSGVQLHCCISWRSHLHFVLIQPTASPIPTEWAFHKDVFYIHSFQLSLSAFHLALARYQTLNIRSTPKILRRGPTLALPVTKKTAFKPDSTSYTNMSVLSAFLPPRMRRRLSLFTAVPAHQRKKLISSGSS